MSVSRFVRVAAAAASIAACAAPAIAHAKPSDKDKTVGAQLRVIDPALGGQVSADFTAYTGTSRIGTSRSATCFGQGTGGSGQPFTLDGPTALGLLNDGAKIRSSLHPISVSDYYLDQFGPALCGVGSSVASGNAYWDLIVNHEESQIGGGQRIHPGDEILWYLSPDFPAGPELQLHLPSIVPAPGAYQATVYQYDAATGKRTPAAGVSVSSAVSPTDASGHTMVTLAGVDGTTRGIGASRATDQAIPDAQRVCIGTVASCPGVRCPSTAALTTIGSRARPRATRFPQAGVTTSWTSRPAARTRSTAAAVTTRSSPSEATATTRSARAARRWSSDELEPRRGAGGGSRRRRRRGGCGLGPGPASVGTATLTVTREYGTTSLDAASEDDPSESETVLRFLDRNADITTRYGGGFVQSIDGLAGSASGDRRSDWFFYVNGIESPVGATGVRVHGGDRIWWDYRDWTDAMRVPAVVGSFPQPFLAADRQTQVDCSGARSPCATVAAALAMRAPT